MLHRIWLAFFLLAFGSGLFQWLQSSTQQTDLVTGSCQGGRNGRTDTAAGAGDQRVAHCAAAISAARCRLMCNCR